MKKHPVNKIEIATGMETRSSHVELLKMTSLRQKAHDKKATIKYRISPYNTFSELVSRR